MKWDFGGHSNHHHDNVYAWVGSALGMFFVSADAYDDIFENNTVAFGNHQQGAWLLPHYMCSNYDAHYNYTSSKWPVSFLNNSYWTQDGVMHTCCTVPPCHAGAGLPWNDWLKGGAVPNSTGFVRPPQDKGSTARIWLQADQEMNYHLLNTARGFLGMPYAASAAAWQVAARPKGV